MKFQDTSTVSIFIPGLSNSRGSKKYIKSQHFHNFVTEVTLCQGRKELKIQPYSGFLNEIQTTCVSQHKLTTFSSMRKVVDISVRRDF